MINDVLKVLDNIDPDMIPSYWAFVSLFVILCIFHFVNRDVNERMQAETTENVAPASGSDFEFKRKCG